MEEEDKEIERKEEYSSWLTDPSTRAYRAKHELRRKQLWSVLFDKALASSDPEVRAAAVHVSVNGLLIQDLGGDPILKLKGRET